MLKFYILIDAENNVTDWGTQLENAIQVKLEGGHDFFVNFLSYKFVDGELVKGEAPETPIVKSEIEQLEDRVALSEAALDFILMNGGS